MKYYSYVDNLNITIDDLINISPYKLKEITLEINKTGVNRKNLILSGLKDPVSRSYHLTIEKNNWLKLLLFKKYKDLKKSKIELNLEHIDYISGFKLFLELYLRPIIPDLINQLINTNQIKLLLNILNQSELFSDACKKDITKLLKEKINYGIKHLHEKQINGSNDNIKYIKSYLFYEILNLYKPIFKSELIKLYDVIIDIETEFYTDSKAPLFKFISQAQVAFQKSQIDDVATKLLIDDNAENAKEYAYNQQHETNENFLKKYLLKYYQVISISFIIGLTIIIAIISFNKIITNKTEQPKYNKNDNTSKKKKQTTYDNRIQFYYSLKLITKKPKNRESLKKVKTKPFSNPYPKTFSQINNDTFKSKHINVLINNKTSDDLIVFKMIKGIDKSIFIPQNNDIHITLNLNDSLLFYSGKKFLNSKFSHFNENAAISEIYKVTSLNNEQTPTITITSSDLESETKHKSILEKNIKTTGDLKLYKMSIDNLYRNYYYKHYN